MCVVGQQIKGIIYEVVNMKQFFKRLFCKHDYIKIDWYQTLDNNGVRYSRRQYRCKKCGKQIWVDGRYDKIGK